VRPAACRYGHADKRSFSVSQRGSASSLFAPAAVLGIMIAGGTVYFPKLVSSKQEMEGTLLVSQETVKELSQVTSAMKDHPIMEGTLVVQSKVLQELSETPVSFNPVTGSLIVSSKTLQELSDIRAKNDAMTGTLVVSHESLQELSNLIKAEPMEGTLIISHKALQELGDSPINKPPWREVSLSRQRISKN
jgi:hypothetical protein